MSSEPAVDFQPIETNDAAVAGLGAEGKVAYFVEQACQLGASDLFFAAEEARFTVRMRHLGAMRDVAHLTSVEGHRCTNHIKALAGIDLVERRRPVDGRWIFQSQAGKVDLRINIIPTLFGEDLTIRIFERDMKLRGLEHLGLLRQQHSELMGMLGSAGGLILVTGPSGAGKSTTLYACLTQLHDGLRKINTIEDPVEYAITGIRQSQVNSAIELDFADLLRAVLRQSPDIIMIGEIRDPLTAQTAIRAANSGHLVLSTLHAPVASAAVQSMLNLGVNSHFLATCLRGVVTQRLVRVLCPECRIKIELDEAPETFADIQRWLEPGEAHAMYAPAACDRCRNMGYIDRTGVFEVMPVMGSVRKLIAHGAGSREIEAEAIREGMIEFRRSGMVKVAQGVTSTEELLRVVPSEYLGVDD